MKVRIGIGTGGNALGIDALGEIADAISDCGFDSIWVSDVLTGQGTDVLVALSWLAGARPGLKLGTTMLLPGRHPLRLARELAVLDRLSAGRLLVTFVPGLGIEPERSAIGVPVQSRGRVIEAVLPVLRSLHAGVATSYEDDSVSFRDFVLEPLPVQQPLEFWLGGMARSSLVRCGRFGDGWLPSQCDPEEAAAGKRVIDEEAEATGRAISPEHFGLSIGYALDDITPEAFEAIRARSRRPDAARFIPLGAEALRTLLGRYLDVGFSKFVLRPVVAPKRWGDELERLADAVGDLQT